MSGGCRRNDDRLILAGQARDRGDVLERHRRLVGEDGADHDIAADDQGVRIAGRLAGELRKADGAAGARHVLHLDVAGNAFLLHHRLHRAGRLVPAAAGSGRRHDGVVGRNRPAARERRREWMPEEMCSRCVLRQARVERARTLFIIAEREVAHLVGGRTCASSCTGSVNSSQTLQLIRLHG